MDLPWSVLEIKVLKRYIQIGSVTITMGVVMPNWINRHVGEVVLAGFGVFGAAAIGFAYNLGGNATKLENLGKGVAAISDQIEAHEDTVNANFDRLQNRLELDQSDLRSILVATGT